MPVSESTAAIYDDLILSQLDPLFRRRMIALVNDQGKCRFNTETDTVQSIANMHSVEDTQLECLYDDITEHHRLSLKFEEFITLTVRGIMTAVLTQWQAWDNPILLYPELRKFHSIEPHPIGSSLKEDHNTFYRFYEFLISSNQYQQFQQSRNLNQLLYGGIVPAAFIGHWNKSVVDELKLDDSIVWRFVDIGPLLSMVNTLTPNYDRPLPDTNLDNPNIPCQISFKDKEVSVLTIGHFQILRHHPIIQKNIDRVRKAKQT